MFSRGDCVEKWVAGTIMLSRSIANDNSKAFFAPIAATDARRHTSGAFSQSKQTLNRRKG